MPKCDVKRPWIKGFALIGVVVGLLAGSSSVPTVHANPFVTHSVYVGGSGLSTPTNFFSLGCSRGGTGETGAIILDFGDPGYVSGVGYGAYAPGGGNPFFSVTDIQTRAQNFANGFFSCATSGAFMNLIIGTTNYGSQVANGHGAAWASMVNALQAWIVSPPSYAGKIVAHGGSDIEMNYNSYSVSASWVQSYDSVNQRNMYDFGDAAGCPFTQSGDLTGQTGVSLACNNGWTQDMVSYVSWRNPAAYPFPEIYSEAPAGSAYSANAIQWQRIASYYHQHYNTGWMFISGVLTQRGACDYNGGAGACPGTYNSPSQGYNQLFNALNYLDWGYVQQTPGWSSDINWQP